MVFDAETNNLSAEAVVAAVGNHNEYISMPEAFHCLTGKDSRSEKPVYLFILIISTGQPLIFDALIAVQWI